MKRRPRKPKWLRMLEILVPGREFYDEKADDGLGAFIQTKEHTLKLEHSLLSISKWEAKWHKKYLSGEERTPEEMLDYIRCMTVNPTDPIVYRSLTRQNIMDIENYIKDPMTATTFRNDPNKRPNRHVPSSEELYYDMTAMNIPFEPCEKWHLNRLMTLIRICSIKNTPPKKGRKGRGDTARQWAAMNKERRSRLGTTG